MRVRPNLRRWRCIILGMTLLAAWHICLHRLEAGEAGRAIARTATNHQDPAGLPPGKPDAKTRFLHLAAGKSAIIELPAPISDVIIGNPAIADAVVRSRRHVYVIGLAAGETNVLFLGENAEELLLIDIQVTRDLSALDQALRELIPSSRIKTRFAANTIILTGAAGTPAEAANAVTLAERFAGKTESVVNLLTVNAKEQVALTVTVAEVNRTEMQRLGIHWRDVAWTAGALSGQFSAYQAFPVTSGVAVPAGLVQGALKQPGSGAGMLTGFTAGNISGASLIEALERHGNFRILAEPVLTAITGETANFLAGGEFPIPVARNDDQISVEWKPFGVGLAFTPVVLSEGRIALKIAMEVSELSGDGAVQSSAMAIPAISVRRVTSSVELPSGGAVVLAGLLSEETRKNADAVPGLSKLPILGDIFASQDYVRSQTELVVIVAPYIVTSAPRSALTPPSAALSNGWTGAFEPVERIISHQQNQTSGLWHYFWEP